MSRRDVVIAVLMLVTAVAVTVCAVLLLKGGCV